MMSFSIEIIGVTKNNKKVILSGFHNPLNSDMCMTIPNIYDIEEYPRLFEFKRFKGYINISGSKSNMYIKHEITSNTYESVQYQIIAFLNMLKSIKQK